MGKFTGTLTTSAKFRMEASLPTKKKKIFSRSKKDKGKEKKEYNDYLEDICQLIDRYHSTPKYLVMQRQEILMEIITACSSCAGPGLADRDDPLHIKAIKALGYFCIGKIQREQARAETIEKLVNTTGPRGLRGAFRFEKLNKPGLPGMRGDDLTKLTGDDALMEETLLQEYGIELTGNDGQDYYMLKKLIKEARGTGNAGVSKWGLIYMDQDQRNRYKLSFTTNQVLRNGNPYTTVDRDENIYAASPAGTIFACSVIDEGRKDFTAIYERMGFNTGAFMHHTSFLSGADVLCAGTLVVNAGRLLSITNMSGHYKPDINNLQGICAAIIGAGYDPRTDGFASFWDFDGDIFPHLKTTPSRGNPTGGNLFDFPLAEFVRDGHMISNPASYAQHPIVAPVAAPASTWVTGTVGAGSGKGKGKRGNFLRGG